MEAIVWFLCCAGVGYYADRKGRSKWRWGIASAIFSPLMVGIVLALMSDRSVERDVAALRMDQQQLRDRVAMDEKVMETRFSHMEGRLGGATEPVRALEEIVLCPGCRAEVHPSDRYCPRCGEMLFG